MLQKIRSLSLEKQIFFGFLSISLSLLTLSLGVTLTFALTRQKRELDKNISSIAAYVASMEQVTAMLKDGYPYPAAIRELDAIHQYFPDINVLAVYDANGLRFYHTNRQESGETYVEGEQDDILAGSEPYITTGFGTRAHSAGPSMPSPTRTVLSWASSSPPSLLPISQNRPGCCFSPTR